MTDTKDSAFTRVDRPQMTPAPFGTRPGTFAAAIAATLEYGDAVAVPVNGETYAVTRNRKCGQLHSLARRLNAHVRTHKSGDGQSLLIWLEPKAVQS